MKQIEYNDNKKEKCECGMFFYCPTQRSIELHNLSFQHKKRISKIKQIINIELFRKKDLYEICRVNLNPDRTYKYLVLKQCLKRIF